MEDILISYRGVTVSILSSHPHWFLESQMVGVGCMTNVMHLTNRVNALLNHRGTSSEGFGTHFLPRNSSVIDLSIGLFSIHELSAESCLATSHWSGVRWQLTHLVTHWFFCRLCTVSCYTVIVWANLKSDGIPIRVCMACCITRRWVAGWLLP